MIRVPSHRGHHNIPLNKTEEYSGTSNTGNIRTRAYFEPCISCQELANYCFPYIKSMTTLPFICDEHTSSRPHLDLRLTLALYKEETASVRVLNRCGNKLKVSSHSVMVT